MKVDERLFVDGLIDFLFLLGEWFNIKLDINYIKKLILSYFNDSLIINIYGFSDESLIYWGEVEVIFYGFEKLFMIVGGFYGFYNFDGIEIFFVFNCKLGIMVI